MSNWLKQSASVVISFGPFLDKTDGVTEETGLVSSLDNGTTGIKLSKNGGALTIRHASVTATTYDAYGMYRVTLDTTDTNTLGTLRVAFNEAATCLPVWQDFMVLPANIYDSLVGGSDLLDVSMTQILGTAVSTPATAGVLDVNIKNAGNVAWASGAIVAGAIATGAITNAKFAAGAIDAAAIADSAIDNATFAADVGSTAYATNKIALAADKAIANAALATAANLAIVDDFLDTEIAAIKAKTDNLPAAPAAAGDIPTAAGIADAVWDEASSGHLAAGSTGLYQSRLNAIFSSVDAIFSLGGEDGHVSILETIPTAAGIADAVWDEAQIDHVAAGSMGSRIDNLPSETASVVLGSDPTGSDIGTVGDIILNIPTAAGIADAVWDEAIVGHLTAGSAGSYLESAWANVSNAYGDIHSIFVAGGEDGTVVANNFVAAPDAAAIADAVWEEAKLDHYAAGTMGLVMNQIGVPDSNSVFEDLRDYINVAAANPGAIADAVWDEVIDPDHMLPYTAGGVLTTVRDDAATAGALAPDITAIKAKTDNLPAEPASRTNITAASGVAVTSIANNVVTAAVLDASAAAEFAARILDGENLDTGLTVRHGLELAAGGILNKLTGAGTGIEKVRNFSDTDDLASVTLDINGNKTAVAYNFSI